MVTITINGLRLMAFNINEFSQNIDEFGTALSSKYDVNIALPNAMLDSSFNNATFIKTAVNNLVPFRADNVSTPGIALLTNDTNKWGVGPRIKQAYNAVVSPVNMRFLADASGELEAFFNTWLNLGFNFAEDSSMTPSLMANYRDDVVSSEINIIKYDRMGNVINTYNLYNAIPTMMSPIQLGWDEQNQLVKFIVSFSYQNFSIS